ncbi:MAG: 2-oxoglutarate dehydrogenase E1 component [Rhodospirillaceae bacterium]|nr:2-oxoglutarate dehydrogenase E1 component [Rhodospirillaceae bacterium]
MTELLERTSFLNSTNSTFVAELYARYLEKPATVDPEWKSFFDELKDEAPDILRDLIGASWAPRVTAVIGTGTAAEVLKSSGAAAPAADGRLGDVTRDSIQALMIIRSHRVRGHLYAELDPLGLEQPLSHTELDPESYGFSEADYDREIYIHDRLGLGEKAPLRDIVERARETYCGHIGVEYMHITSPDEKIWIQDRIEGIHNHTDFTDIGKTTILERLTEAETFEQFLNVKYTGTKRFGLDGAEALVPALEQVLKRGRQLGVEEVVIGMPHRGRLNVLANVMNKPFSAIFSEFEGTSATPEEVQGSGDVKYHLGTSADREFDGEQVHLSLAANPSHLEAVDPVVVGKVRAKQRQRGDKERRKVLGLLVHGDAAFGGQGIVAETFGLSDIKGYRTGGTIHVVVNNQIGFTTNPAATRTSRYPTEIAKMAQAPIFHVNGDDVEAVIHVARIATEFRHEFRKDVVIDIWCYRRFGHNEGDEPAFTQPKMYQAIANHPTTRQIYANQLIAENVITEEGVEEIQSNARARLDTDFEASKSYKPNKADWLEGKWQGLTTAPSVEERKGKTDVPFDLLREVGAAISAVPDDLNINSKLRRFFDNRGKSIKVGEGIDWATGEALAFGTLLTEGHLVRLSGQDVARGTFSQRHVVVTDQENESVYIPLEQIRPGNQAKFIARNSTLSEAAVLGFEYGLSLADPEVLVMWEAQFGDFANGAQFIFDQFISSGESKWLRMSGLVMLLPHGFEGQGPEHSSARLERYLQLCAEDNWQVCNITTPANYFHALRRQIHRDFRKPLVITTPKSLLRHKGAVSKLEDFGPGTSFNRVLPETGDLVARTKIKRVVLCSGKVYFDLLAAREEMKISNMALVRLEQLYPFPSISLSKELKKYPNADVVWCQEEPKNMGAWTFMDRRIEELLGNVDIDAERPIYAGRPEAASPATGSHGKHTREQQALVEDALTI